jgi:diguanylate cyclase (GGDEF)-like protein/PAS domain S-box-containing protein
MRAIRQTAMKRSQLRFKRMRDYAEAIVQTVREPLVVLDAELRIKSVNQAFCDTFNVSTTQAKDRFIYALGKGEWKFKRLRPLLNELLAQKSTTPHCEVNSYFTGKAHKTMLLNARRIPGIGTGKPLILLAIEDITERKHAERALEKLIETYKQESLTDPLTGLYNRRAFLTMGAQFLRIGRRMGKGIFVLFVDLDGLKQINDQRGHSEGDQTLIKAANILRKTFRQSDIVARIGGDEFAIITIERLPGSIATLMARLNGHAMQTNGDAPISLSTGIAHSDASETSTIEDLIEKADAAMYDAKQQKRKLQSAAPAVDTADTADTTPSGLTDEKDSVAP